MKLIDFSPLHNVLLRNQDGSLRPMDEPYYEAREIAPNTWSILSDGDFAYLVVGDNEGIAIDSGAGAGNLQEYMQTLTDKPVRKIANTHHHFDHTANNWYFDTVYMAKEGVDLATIPFKSFEGIHFPRDYHVEVIQDGDVLHLGNRDLEVFAMPDHAISSLVYLDRKGRILFVGDELSNHGKDLSGSVQNFADQLERLMQYRSEYDHLCGGSDAMISADYVDWYLENCKYILAGHEGRPFERRKPPKGKDRDRGSQDGTIIYDRKKPRPVDRGTVGGPESDRDQYLRVMDYAGVSIVYDVRKVR